MKRRVSIGFALVAVALVAWLAAGPGEPARLDSIAGTARILALSDGRQLGYRTGGDPRGRPVLVLHGIPGSRLLYVGDEGIWIRRGLRLIQIDRPGFGASTPAPGMSFAGHGRDVAQLMDSLGVKRFAVLGWSAGTPWALALGESLPDRVERIAVVGALMPPDDPGVMSQVNARSRAMYWLALHWPNALGRVFQGMSWLFRKDPSAFFQSENKGHPKVDLDVIESPPMAQSLLLSLHETVRHGPMNMARELRRMASPWGIEWSRIEAPVRFWHGTADVDTPPAASRSLARRIRGAAVTEVAGEGHYLIVPRLEEILNWLCPAVP